MLSRDYIRTLRNCMPLVRARGTDQVVHVHAAHPAPPIGRPGTGARLRESTCQ